MNSVSLRLSRDRRRRRRRLREGDNDDDPDNKDKTLNGIVNLDRRSSGGERSVAEEGGSGAADGAFSGRIMSW